MTAQELVHECHLLQVHLAPDGIDRLTVSAPKGTLTPRLLDLLKLHKFEVLDVLAERMERQRTSKTGQAVRTQLLVLRPNGWPVDTFHMPPCPKCTFSDYWQAAVGDLFGHTDPPWRCSRCDPPIMPRAIRG